MRLVLEGDTRDTHNCAIHSDPLLAKHVRIVGDTGEGALMLELDLTVDMACDLEVCLFSV